VSWIFAYERANRQPKQLRGCPIRAPQRRQAADQRFSARQPRRETSIQLGPVPAHVLTQKSAARRWCAHGDDVPRHAPIGDEPQERAH
jgi:hypothetical protein